MLVWFVIEILIHGSAFILLLSGLTHIRDENANLHDLEFDRLYVGCVFLENNNVRTEMPPGTNVNNSFVFS